MYKYLSSEAHYLTCFIDPYPYPDYLATLRTNSTREILHQMEQEAIVLLENHDVLPLSVLKTKSIALIGPQANRVSVNYF